MGFESALIQDNLNINDSKIFSAWTMEVLKGIILCVVLFSFSHQISLFLEETEVKLLLQLTSLIFVMFFLVAQLYNKIILIIKKNNLFFILYVCEYNLCVFTVLICIRV